MTQYSFPWNDVNGDRLYDAEDFMRFFAAFLKTGVVMSYKDGLRVRSSQNGMNIQVGGGSAVIGGGSYLNDENIAIQVNVASSAQNRTDSVVLRMDKNARDTYLYYKPSDTTVVRNDILFELQLATISVKMNAAQITDADITDMRSNPTVCGWSTPFDNINVDGIVDQYKGIFAQADIEFQAWFQNLQDQLDDNQAANLLKQIDAVKASAVTLDTNQTITAIKAFKAAAYFNTIATSDPQINQALQIRQTKSDGTDGQLLGMVSNNPQLPNETVNGFSIGISTGANTILAGGEAHRALLRAIQKPETTPPALSAVKGGAENAIVVGDNDAYIGTNYQNGGATGNWWKFGTDGILISPNGNRYVEEDSTGKIAGKKTFTDDVTVKNIDVSNVFTKSITFGGAVLTLTRIGNSVEAHFSGTSTTAISSGQTVSATIPLGFKPIGQKNIDFMTGADQTSYLDISVAGAITLRGSSMPVGTSPRGVRCYFTKDDIPTN